VPQAPTTFYLLRSAAGFPTQTYSFNKHSSAASSTARAEQGNHAKAMKIQLIRDLLRQRGCCFFLNMTIITPTNEKFALPFGEIRD
jgi:hypothetical protein